MPEHVFVRKYRICLRYKHRHFPALNYTEDSVVESPGMTACFRNKLDWFKSNDLFYEGYIWIKCLATNEVTDADYMRLNEDNLRWLTKKIQQAE